MNDLTEETYKITLDDGSTMRVRKDEIIEYQGNYYTAEELFKELNSTGTKQ